MEVVARASRSGVLLQARIPAPLPDVGRELDCVAVIDELRVRPGDYVVDKYWYGAFFRTNLHDILLSEHVDTVAVCGTVTQVCVEETAREAFHLGLKTVVLSDCVSSFDAGHARRHPEELRAEVRPGDGRPVARRRDDGNGRRMTSGNADDFAGLIERLGPQLGPVDVSAASGDGIIHAAVALLLRDSATGAEILFIKRSERQGDPWSGHLAFPGGRAERSDPSLAGVAVREAREEVGIDLQRGGRILGSLPAVQPLSARLPPIAVTPFLAVAPDGAAARADPGEVEEAFWMPLAALKTAGPAAVVRRASGEKSGSGPPTSRRRAASGGSRNGSSAGFWRSSRTSGPSSARACRRRRRPPTRCCRRTPR